MERSVVLSIVGTCFSINSGVTTIVVINERSKTNRLHEMPLIFLYLTHYCQVFWLLYGLAIRNTEMTVVNIITTLLSLTALVFYYQQARKLMTLGSAYLLSAVFLAFILLTSFNAEFTGKSALVLSVVAIASTLESAYKTIMTGNHQYINLKMCISSIVSGTIWLLFGFEIQDLITIYVNLFVLVIFGLLLAVSFFYRLTKGKIE